MNQPLDRTTIERWLQEHIAAIETGNLSALMTEIDPRLQIALPRETYKGQEQSKTFLIDTRERWEAVRIYVRRLLIDCQQSVAAVEWVCRGVEKETGICHQLLGAAALDFTADGRLTRCKIYLDQDRSGEISDLDAPWPTERWSPCTHAGTPPTRSQSERLLHAHAAAWSSGDAEQVGNLLHDEVHLCPPWTYREGKEQVKAIARYHFDTFDDTEVTPRRIIYDESQPTLGICQQTFACTNPKTGLRGTDSDFALFEICQGKVRYWRNYFDTARSVQEAYKEGRLDRV